VAPGECAVVLVTGTGLKTPRYLTTDREPLAVGTAAEEVVALLATGPDPG
jgi:hypothetical protein